MCFLFNTLLLNMYKGSFHEMGNDKPGFWLSDHMILNEPEIPIFLLNNIYLMVK